MLVLASFWSVILINAGMIGVFFEALIGRVYRAWMIVPLLFYGAYYSAAAMDDATLSSLRASYDSANAKVRIPFDPQHHSLVFENESLAGYLTQNYAIDVAYENHEPVDGGYLSTRLIAQPSCDAIKKSRSLPPAINVYWFHDSDEDGSQVFERRFCNLRLPEMPTRPAVTIASQKLESDEQSLPMELRELTITMPDGQDYTLKTGRASPLSWFPLPVMGCGLNSSVPSWDCDAGFMRRKSEPIISGEGRYGRDAEVLARASGLDRVSIEDRKAVPFPEDVSLGSGTFGAYTGPATNP